MDREDAHPENDDTKSRLARAAKAGPSPLADPALASLDRRWRKSSPTASMLISVDWIGARSKTLSDDFAFQGANLVLIGLHFADERDQPVAFALPLRRDESRVQGIS